MDDLIYILGMAAVAVSAITGVLEAGRKPIDLFGVVLVALASALGGGTLRDLILDRPVFWLADETYLFAAVLAGLATVPVVRLFRLPPNLFLVPDAIGLALFTVLGTGIALKFGAPWFAATFLGADGSAGRVLRDMMCNEVPLIFAGPLYGTAAWIGAIAYAGMVELGAGAWSIYAAMGIVVGVRLLAVRRDINLPTFVARR